MPRSSGTYTLPAGNPVVTDTTITTDWANGTLNDIANELTNSIPRDGSAPPTANLPMGNFKLTGLAAGTVSGDAVRYEQAVLIAGSNLTGAINEALSTVAATATTTPLWDAAYGNVQTWTGTPAITALPNAPQAGASREVYPAAGTTITADANLLVAGLASGSTYTFAASDSAEIVAQTTTTFQVFINKYDGSALNAIGYGQTRQNLLASRSLGVTYINTTKKPITVAVYVQITSVATDVSLVAGGLLAERAYSSAWPSSSFITLKALVIPGESYRCEIPVGTATLTAWTELR